MTDQWSEIDAVIEGTRRIAVVGASANPTRPSHGVFRVLLDAGYDVVPVNPNADEVCGVPAVGSLDEVEGVIDLVDVFRRPEHAPDIARQAVAVGARALWLQVGITSPEARRIATDGGLRFVQDACLGVVVDKTRHAHRAAT